MSNTLVQRVVVRNAAAGSGDFPKELFYEFQTVDIRDLDVWAKTAVFDENLLVAVWGGDGSCRAVAGHLVGTESRMLPCPGGTLNHFAHSVELHTVEDVRRALRTGETREVDVGWAGDAIFLNNASLGWYVDLVARRERYGRSMPALSQKCFR